MVETEKVYGQTLQAVAPYIAIGIVGYLGLRWIQANNPLGGLVPGGGGGPIFNIFGGQKKKKEEKPGQEILEKKTTGKRLKEQVTEEEQEIQLERQGLDFKTYEEQDIAEEVRKNLPDASQEKIQEEIARRRAQLHQKREAIEEMVEGLETGKFTTGKESKDKRLVQEFRRKQHLHQETIEEEKEIAKERKDLNPATPEEQRIKQQKFREAHKAVPGKEEFTPRQKRILRHTTAMERAREEQNREKKQQGKEKPEKSLQPVDVVAQAGMKAAQNLGNVLAPGLGPAIQASRILGKNDGRNRQTEEQRTGFHIPFT